MPQEFQVPLGAPKARLRLAVIGHSGVGKSTLLGRLGVQYGKIDNSCVEDAQSAVKRMDCPSHASYTFLLDRTSRERQLRQSTTWHSIEIETSRYHVTLLDTPGGKKYIKSTIRAICQADAVILLVPSSKEQFEKSYEDHLGMTKEHSLLAYTFGVHRIIVAINNMDSTEPESYSQIRYNEVMDRTSYWLRKIGYKQENTYFLPCSVLKGDNIFDSVSNNMTWYAATKGKSLLRYIDELPILMKNIEKPLRIPVQKVHTIKDNATIAVGRVESGCIDLAEKITIAPPTVTTQVISLESEGDPLDAGLHGDFVGVNLGERICQKDPNSTQKTLQSVRPGSLIGNHEYNPPASVKSFTAQLMVLNHRGGGVRVGYTPLVYCHATRVACTFVQLLSRNHVKTGAVLHENPQILKPGQAGVVRLKPVKGMSVEPFYDYPQLARLAIRDNDRTVAVGVVTSVEREE